MYSGLTDMIITLGGSEWRTCSIRLATSLITSQTTKVPGGIGEKPRLLGFLWLFLPAPQTHRRTGVDLGHCDEALRRGPSAGLPSP